MFASCLRLGRHSLWRSSQPINGDRARLRTAIEADAASGAVVPGVVRRMDAIVTQLRRKLEAFGRARLDAEPASFALLDIDCDLPARWTRHILLLTPCQSVTALSADCSSMHWHRMLQPVRFLAGLPKLRTKIWMGNLDQGLRPFANRLAVQISDAELGYDITHEATRSDYARTGVEHRNDPRNGSMLCRGRDGNDRLAALGARCSADKVDLSANSAVEGAADGIGTDLTREIDLDGGVDRHHFVVARD